MRYTEYKKLHEAASQALISAIDVLCEHLTQQYCKEFGCISEGSLDLLECVHFDFYRITGKEHPSYRDFAAVKRPFTAFGSDPELANSDVVAMAACTIISLAEANVEDMEDSDTVYILHSMGWIEFYSDEEEGEQAHGVCRANIEGESQATQLR